MLRLDLCRLGRLLDINANWRRSAALPHPTRGALDVASRLLSPILLVVGSVHVIVVGRGNTYPFRMCSYVSFVMYCRGMQVYRPPSCGGRWFHFRASLFSVFVGLRICLFLASEPDLYVGGSYGISQAGREALASSQSMRARKSALTQHKRARSARHVGESRENVFGCFHFG
jgi:hypothetical protein